MSITLPDTVCGTAIVNLPVGMVSAIKPHGLAQVATSVKLLKFLRSYPSTLWVRTTRSLSCLILMAYTSVLKLISPMWVKSLSFQMTTLLTGYLIHLPVPTKAKKLVLSSISAIFKPPSMRLFSFLLKGYKEKISKPSEVAVANNS